MKKDEFIDKLIDVKLLEPIYKHLIKYVCEPIDNDENILKIIVLYFTYICAGSSCMPIDDKILKEEWEKKCNDALILLKGDLNDNDLEFIQLNQDIISLIDEGQKIISHISELNNHIDLVGNNKLFCIDNGFLFARQYFEAKEGIKESINRIFMDFIDSQMNDKKVTDIIDIDKIWASAAKKQKEVIEKGFYNNLIVTGGPGTGKTTAVFYLLLALLKIHSNANIYLTAPSGKASSRISESIKEEITKLDINGDIFKNEIDILNKVEGKTIHSLLGIDFLTNDFKHNKNNQFEEDSIFIIDESSMIDVSIFNSLLNAIPTGARVFILGDKYQLPSVECGAVLSDLVNYNLLDKYKVELTESHRFNADSDVGGLAIKVNNGEQVIPSWKTIGKDESIDIIEGKYPVYYYDLGNIINMRQSFPLMIEKWALHYYKDLKTICDNVEFIEASLDDIYSNIDTARILCAENNGIFGVNTINEIMIKKLYNRDDKTNIRGYYPGIPLMITENNNALDLYNGDTGILIRFKDSDTLYFLIEKDNKKYKDDALIIEDKIIKLGKYMLYPLRMLDLKKVTYAYGITIHKSQGSGYSNIMVILPKKTGHPLLNRQILYTAITRTKGATYIISDENSLNEAIKHVMKRYTRIFE